MSSSYILEPQESEKKKDDTLIIVVNDDGTIAVDQETFQNLIMNQANANVSVVRVGQTEGDAENGELTFTVDPPAFTPTDTTSTNTASGATDTGLVDPFMEMDPEQLEKLETALQSEQAKQILGENVAAMLDMLTVEEQQNSIRYAIELDHCYTSRTSPLDPEPLDPLPVANSPDIDQHDLPNTSVLNQSQSTTSALTDTTRAAATTPLKPVVKVKQPVGRPRKVAVTNVPTLSNIQKSPATAAIKNSGVIQSDRRRSVTKEEENNADALSSSTESSESAESDNDSDFGPRGPRRPGVRARGGRRGLTTRGGSMAASRRRGPSKRMDVDQVRRLDIEMAAAVNAMKSPEQVEKSSAGRKQLKTIPSRKKDDVSPVKPTGTNETSVVAEKPLQTTNQVKANLINANMIKGDMILTKPGQGRSNQKVFFVQKKVVVKPNELKTMGAKQNSIVFTKDTIKSTNQIQTKLGTSDDGKLISVTSKLTTQPSSQDVQSEINAVVTPTTAIAISPTTTTPTTTTTTTTTTAPTVNPLLSPVTSSPIQSSTQVTQKQLPKVIPPTGSIKIKPVLETKKEKKKSESNDTVMKVEELPKPTVEVKTPDSSKKHVKKDQRKSPGHVADALGPALFSTPDIIRRVGSGAELKSSDTNVSSSNSTSDTSIPEVAPPSSLTPTVIPSLKTDYSSLGPDMQPETANLLAESESPVEDYGDEQTSTVLDNDERKTEQKLSVIDDLQTPLDPASNTAASTEKVARPSADSVGSNISEQTGIDGEEHLFATIAMEASKNEDDLLAEVLLLQDTLGVDLTDTGPLDSATSSISDPLLSPSTFDTAMLPVTSADLSAFKSPTSQLTTESPLSSPNSDQIKRKDSKEPIQIVRGGRVITLPPIEAPATRSKRLQVKPEPAQKIYETPKKEEKIQKLVTPQQLKHIDEMESEIDDDDEEEDNSDSEDDPNRLWCICKRPHNNRFMICCDVCEDWFHGKCVHVSKAMGQQMEEQGIEWVCPNCAKKKIDGSGTKVKSPSVKPTKISESPSQRLVNETPTTQSPDKPTKPAPDTKPGGGQAVAGLAVTQCVVCKKEARNSSIYCSDACILMHAQETLTKDKPSPQTKVVKTTGEVVKTPPDARVIVFERRTGKVLTGIDAPTTSNLKTWLKEHPTFEVVRSNNLNTLQIGGKMVTAIQTQGPGKIAKTSQQQSMPGQAKMVYTKIVGSKQTILSSSNKKIGVISNFQNANILSKPSGQVKHAVLISSTKSPTILKQMTIKTVPQQPKSTVVSKQTPVKKQEQKVAPSVTKLQQKSPNVKKSEPEPIRLNVRKTLAESLTIRIKETSDLKLTDEEISHLAVSIEVELYKYFRDTGAKYKAKYRSLVFNIKDTKNLTLFRKIADRSLTPDAVVRLSPDEMASQELAEWREKETKHQLEMIKKNELDLMAQAKSIVVKTHKGEQIIENDGGIDAVDPKTPVQDIVTVLNHTDNTSFDVLDEKEETTMSSLEEAKKTKRYDEKKKKEKDRERDKDGHRSRKKERSNKDSKRDKSTSRNRSHRSRDRSRDRRRSKDEKRDKEKDRDRERDRDKNKDKDKQKDKDRSRRSSRSSSTRSKSSHKESKDKEKKRSENEDEPKREEDKKKETSPIPADKPIEDRLWRHIEDETTTNTLDGNDSDVSDREPSSTVNIKTPDINEEVEKEKETPTETERVNHVKEQEGQAPQTVWRGFVNMVDVAKFFITAQEISGHAKDLMEDLPDTVDVVGRISHQTVWDYISTMKKNGTKEILVIRLTAANDEEKIPYITLYSYLNSRSRFGVVGNVSKNIKDFYIMPFSNKSQIPPVLLPMNGPGFEDNRPHLLLGIIVRNKRKRLPHPLPAVPTIPAKQSKKDPERSYTPPIVHAAKDQSTNITDKPQQSDIVEKSAVTQLTLNTLNKAHVGMSRGHIDSATISKIVPELSSKIDLTSSPDKAPLERDDDDEPYSPGDIEEDAEDSLARLTAASNLLMPAKNSTELQRKIDELNRQIEEQKQQIQTISSSFLGEAVPILPGLGQDPPDVNDADEAYSPTDVRSFTPPPPGISKFAQPILDKVSDITIPSNLQEILANVKRQECSKVDSYLPSKPSASFLTSINPPLYQKTEKPTYIASPTSAKETKSTLRSLSDFDLIKKAEEELAAVAAASMSVVAPNCPTPDPPSTREHVDSIDTLHEISPPHVESHDINYPPNIIDKNPKSRASDQPKPPGLEDEDYPTFPSTPPPMINIGSRSPRSSQKFIPKSGVVLSVKRKMNDENASETPLSPTKTARIKSRWGQGPSD